MKAESMSHLLSVSPTCMEIPLKRRDFQHLNEEADNVCYFEDSLPLQTSWKHQQSQSS